jgi:hypothetical protein
VSFLVDVGLLGFEIKKAGLRKPPVFCSVRSLPLLLDSTTNRNPKSGLSMTSESSSKSRLGVKLFFAAHFASHPDLYWTKTTARSIV